MTTSTTSVTADHDAPNEPGDDDAGHDDGHGHGMTDLGYVKIAIALSIITAIEVLLSYQVDNLGAFFLPLLLGLMLIKFFSVVLYFMHLKFDNRLFGVMFYIGIGLAILVYFGALLTFEFFSG
jgi:cytochrome c oxidase subunit 4